MTNVPARLTDEKQDIHPKSDYLGRVFGPTARRLIRQIPLLGCVLGCTAGGDGPDPQDGPTPLPQVASVQVLAEPAGRVSWCGATDEIAFDRLSDDQVYDVFVNDRTGDGERCVTCDSQLLPRRHHGNPDWHPSGDYMVVVSEKEDHPAGTSSLSTPGLGLYCDLWLVTAAGDAAWQLTDLPIDGVPTAVLHPHFSHDGEALLWSSRVGTGGLWGEWELRVARLEWLDGQPALVDPQTFQPGAQQLFYETHGWSLDDSRLLFTGNLDEGQSEWGTDLYWMDLDSGDLEQLTDSPDDWDELATLSPDGGAIVWNSSAGLDLGLGAQATEYWIMRPDGAEPTPLTTFNDPDSEYYSGERIVVADSSFSPDGNTLAGYVIADGDRYAGRLLLLELR